jgi:hypothetical protein
MHFIANEYMYVLTMHKPVGEVGNVYFITFPLDHEFPPEFSPAPNDEKASDHRTFESCRSIALENHE